MKSSLTIAFLEQLLNVDSHFPNKDLAITSIAIDSRKAISGSLYCAMVGTQSNGHDFISAAIANGAKAILVTQKVDSFENIAIFQVSDINAALGKICNAFYHHPSQSLKLVGVTGTNGKTSITTMLFAVFSSMSYTCGLISTVEIRIAAETLNSTHTTPDIISLYQTLEKMVLAGVQYCFMEVSSHAIHQQRIAGLQFAGAIFSNLSHDHLDYHKTFENYRDAKKMFFDQLDSDSFALTNKDDKNGLYMLQNCVASKYTYSVKSQADFKVKIIESDFNGMLIQIDGKEAWISLVGEFNAYNLAAVYGASFLLTEGQEDLLVQISQAKRVRGRFEVISGPDKKVGIIDYAHTPDALENVLETINKIRARAVQLITVMGCGGDRDKSKRPEMGKIAARLSDKVILTSDNPRSENPDEIIADIEKGIEGQHYKKLLKITDRKEAIKTACMIAQTGDVILIAGKGHETYQEILGVKHPFDDRQILTQIFQTT